LYAVPAQPVITTEIAINKIAAGRIRKPGVSGIAISSQSAWVRSRHTCGKSSLDPQYRDGEAPFIRNILPGRLSLFEFYLADFKFGLWAEQNIMSPRLFGVSTQPDCTQSMKREAGLPCSIPTGSNTTLELANAGLLPTPKHPM
jgi:hypothetical protein